MIGRLKNLAAGAVARSGVVRTLARRRLPGHLAILMYHGVTPEPLPVRDWCFIEAAAFRRQLEYLARHCAVLPLEQAATLLGQGQLAAHTGGRPAVAITFDDGYANNAEVAAPLLREFGLPATVFLNTGLVGSRQTLWFCRLHRALGATFRPHVEWQGQRWPLGSPAERAAASAALQAALKTLPHQPLHAALDALLRALEADPTAEESPDSPYAFMSVAQVQSLAREGLIDFGAHTRDHTILAPLDGATQREQIVSSVEQATAWLGRPCTTFAYPNGRAQDFTSETCELVRAAGVRVAVTTIEQPAAPGDDPLRLGRYGIGAGLPQSHFEIIVHHGRAMARRG